MGKGKEEMEKKKVKGNLLQIYTKKSSKKSVEIYIPNFWF